MSARIISTLFLTVFLLGALEPRGNLDISRDPDASGQFQEAALSPELLEAQFPQPVSPMVRSRQIALTVALMAIPTNRRKFFGLFSTMLVASKLQAKGYQPTAWRAERLSDMIARILKDPHEKIEFKTAQNSPRVDLFVDHGRAKGSWERAAQRGDIRDGAILLHFDSHPDNMRNVAIQSRPTNAMQAEAEEYDIASFIFPSLAHGLVSEVYDIRNRRIPVGLRPSKKISMLWITTYLDPFGAQAIWTSEEEASQDQVLQDIRKSFESRNLPGESIRVLKSLKDPIKIHLIYMDDLPDFSAEKRSIIVDIDEDVLGTLELQNKNSDVPEEVRRDAMLIARKLRQSGVHPGVVTFSLSEGWTPPESMAPVTEAFLENFQDQGLIQLEGVKGDQWTTRSWHQPDPGFPALLEIRHRLQAGDSPQQLLKKIEKLVKNYGPMAVQQQSKSLAYSPSLHGGERSDLPSPVVLWGQRELNAVAEALFIRAIIYAHQRRWGAALDQLVVMRRQFPSAYMPILPYAAVPISGDDGTGWTNAYVAGQGWQTLLYARMLLASNGLESRLSFRQLPPERQSLIRHDLQLIASSTDDAATLNQLDPDVHAFLAIDGYRWESTLSERIVGLGPAAEDRVRFLNVLYLNRKEREQDLAKPISASARQVIEARFREFKFSKEELEILLQQAEQRQPDYGDRIQRISNIAVTLGSDSNLLTQFDINITVDDERITLNLVQQSDILWKLLHERRPDAEKKNHIPVPQAEQAAA